MKKIKRKTYEQGIKDALATVKKVAKSKELSAQAGDGMACIPCAIWLAEQAAKLLKKK